MPRVEIYSTLFCPYCSRAKSLLDRKGVKYINFDVIEDNSKREEMLKRAGAARVDAVALARSLRTTA